MLLLLLLRPGILLLVPEFDDDSESRALEDMGSMVSWPVCIADRTERRESQLREGARSSRTVGSLQRYQIRAYLQDNRLTNLRKTGALGTPSGGESSSQAGLLMRDVRCANGRQTSGIPDREDAS
jgi:hypothetical protein